MTKKNVYRYKSAKKDNRVKTKNAPLKSSKSSAASLVLSIAHTCGSMLHRHPSDGSLFVVQMIISYNSII